MKSLYLLLLVLFGATHFTKAQTVSQYNFNWKTGVALEDMSSGASLLIGADADGINSPSIAFFPFTFAGKSFNNFSVTEDGAVVLGEAAYTPYPYDNYFTQTPAFFSQSAAYPILLAWGEDLYTANGSISYKITGTAPERKLVIQFKVKSAEDIDEAYNKTFQVWLFEGSNQIQYVYGDVFADWYNNANIGLAASENDYLSVDGATNTARSTSVASNSGTYPDRAPLPVKGTAYLFSPLPIVDVVPISPAPVISQTAPVAASAAITPEYCVPGQNKYTIYLGYGQQAVNLSTTVSGGNPSAKGYTYAWSPVGGLSSATAASPIASPIVTTTYTVTITDGKGNIATRQVTVYVVDARCGNKIKICKSKNELCVAIPAVEAQLKQGAVLGGCPSVYPVGNAARIVGEEDINSLSIATDMAIAKGTIVYPSPSTGLFTIQLTETTQPTTIVVYDVNGQVIAQKVIGGNQQVVQFDLTNKIHGVCMVKVISNGLVQTSKIIIQ